MTQEALPALPNQNDEEAARAKKGPEILILSLAQDTSRVFRDSLCLEYHSVGAESEQLNRVTTEPPWPLWYSG